MVEKSVWVKCHFLGFCRLLAPKNSGGFLPVADLCFFFSFHYSVSWGCRGGEEEYVLWWNFFFPFASIFFYFFRFFFYLLPPTHSQPHRKTTGELTFRVKRGLIMLLLLQRNLQMRTGSKSQVTEPSHRHPLHSGFLLILIRVGCGPKGPADRRQSTVLWPFMAATSQSIAVCFARMGSLAVVEVWKFRVKFLV